MAILSCSAPDCERAAKSKSLCGMHYQRMRSFGYLEKPVEILTCEHCGNQREKDKRSSADQKYCSITCGQAAYRAANKDRINADLRQANASKPLISHSCGQCGGSFESRHKMKKFCSQKCRNRWLDKNNPIRCSESDCDRGVRAKGLCAMHWRREARADGRESNPEWDDRRRANYHKRRALKALAPAEDVRPAVVYERDSWICGLCSSPVDPSLSYPDPMSASLDHVLPLSRGGHHTYENTQLAHLSCNVQKGADVA